jgi:hypothetical protein
MRHDDYFETWDDRYRIFKPELHNERHAQWFHLHRPVELRRGKRQSQEGFFDIEVCGLCRCNSRKLGDSGWPQSKVAKIDIFNGLTYDI